MMLERPGSQTYIPDDDAGQSLSLPFLFETLRRRVMHFVIPFLLILALGSLIALAWPARYLSESKILISSQEIPTELVRPTVSTVANERIQIIQQRILTRDNLLGLAKKFQLKSGWQELASGTDIVDFIRDRIQIKPLELTLQGDRKNAIAFTVGFNYESPIVAAKVANELVTMMLNEDARSRATFAAETTKFLETDVKRLEGELSLLDAQIIAWRDRNFSSPADSQSDDRKDLAALRSELILKSAIYSDKHPDVIALKRKIEALRKGAVSTDISPTKSPNTENQPDTKATAPSTTAPSSIDPGAAGIDAIELKRQSLRTELTGARQKLAAARLGQSLETGQHSERLEIIEQATVPKKPTSPNRPKIFAFSFVVALAVAGGFVFAAETLNPAIRRSADLFSVIDSDLIVSIPYISTLREVRRRRYSILFAIGILVTIVLGGLFVAYFYLPPIDILFSKSMTFLFR